MSDAVIKSICVLDSQLFLNRFVFFAQIMDLNNEDILGLSQFAGSRMDVSKVNKKYSCDRVDGSGVSPAGSYEEDSDEPPADHTPHDAYPTGLYDIHDPLSMFKSTQNVAIYDNFISHQIRRRLLHLACPYVRIQSSIGW